MLRNWIAEIRDSWRRLCVVLVTARGTGGDALPNLRL